MSTNPLRVGDWELVGRLGQGGFGEVQHWKNKSLNQEIATKHIRNAEAMSADQQRKLKERWIKEYNWTREFQELPNIVAGVQLGADSEGFIQYLNSRHIWQLPVIILEYCNRGDVRKLLQQPQNANGLVEFEVREILNCLRQAVDFLHTRCKICHRDLKPDNIVINRLPNGCKQYKLTDFGLARPSPDKTSLQSTVGTRHYYAPEVVDDGKYNIRVDYWSMGIIGYELATGVVPFVPHQTPFNIHTNLRNKQRSCIAITEDIEVKDRFHNHNELAMMHHLSQPFTVEFTKWLTVALDTNYTRRGVDVATDEVQGAPRSPIIFTEIDGLLKIRVLTFFVTFKYQRLEYLLTPTMTMSELAAKIAKDTQFPVSSMLLVLPTGHPHKRISKDTRPVDLYVENWCDTSEESKNPPVMVYIFNIGQSFEYSAPDPCITDLVKYCVSTRGFNPQKWIVERMILDMHYMLSKEQETMRTLLFGLKECAMTLEHDLLEFQDHIKFYNREKDKFLGALELIDAVVTAAKQQQRCSMLNIAEWETNWAKLGSQSKAIVDIIEKTISHYESSLRNIRDIFLKQSEDIYNKFVDDDIYELTRFRKNYLIRGDNLKCSELSDIAINYGQKRQSFLNNESVRYLRDGINQANSRFSKIPPTLQIAYQKLLDKKSELLQLHLQLMPSAISIQQPPIFQLNEAMSRLQFDTSTEPTSSTSLDAFDSLSTKTIIDQALITSQLLENAMETDHS